MIQRSFQDEKPTLFVVSTPIGNLKDITYRAVEVLNQVDLILCEDTRTSKTLLNTYDIHKPLISFHDHNKADKSSDIISYLEDGKNLAIISDAGTPGINDPGYELISEVIEKGFYVVSIPGASAILAALVVSGCLIQPFTFIGFLPRKQSHKKEVIESYFTRTETLVIYESPLRVKKTLEDLYQVLGDRKLVLARELTKMFETITRTTLKASLSLDIDTRGEYVLIVDGSKESYDDSLSIKDHVLQVLKEGYEEKEAMKLVAKKRRITKSDVYKAYKING
ncbi:16S rRNA (cytidine(1402)-2'-O)-methyltransferase [Tenericutes bacterium MZ-XQ]|nr:16S rRNA (cytidine(1402)-2'-O)-methyltransferase [Tenericutes bacterium MZ-XQ]